jgi:hypothetical protein
MKIFMQQLCILVQRIINISIIKFTSSDNQLIVLITIHLENVCVYISMKPIT